MKRTENSGIESKRAIILDGSKENDEEAKMAAEALHAELGRSDTHFTHHVLRDINIANCTGCLRCWTKTPGDCAVKDDQWKICSELAQADLIVLITPVTFGGYSYDLKKGMDRMIPVLLPFFRKYHGETHHPSRYGNVWNLLGVGTMSVQDPEKEVLFKDIVHRNSLNMHSKSSTSIILMKGWGREEIDRTVAAGLRNVTS